jgi:segregation and condensation protein A
MSSVYRVALEVFEGPLDLLLRLVEREELDISQVSLAIVADQYLAHIALLRQLTAANLVSFLTIAAKLLVIKSRSLLPPAEDELAEEEEYDPAADLTRQLLEYKRFKEAAVRLRTIEETGLHTHSRAASPPKPEWALLPGEITVSELLTAFKRALEAHPPFPAVDSVVAPVAVHIADCMQTIRNLLQQHARLSFSSLLRRARSRLEAIVTLLAALEMIKQQRLQAVQEQLFGEIYFEERQPDPEAEIESTDLSEYGEAATED